MVSWCNFKFGIPVALKSIIQWLLHVVLRAAKM